MKTPSNMADTFGRKATGITKAHTHYSMLCMKIHTAKYTERQAEQNIINVT